MVGKLNEIEDLLSLAKRRELLEEIAAKSFDTFKFGDEKTYLQNTEVQSEFEVALVDMLIGLRGYVAGLCMGDFDALQAKAKSIWLQETQLLSAAGLINNVGCVNEDV